MKVCATLVDGDLPAVTRWEGGPALTAQRVAIRLHTHLGEQVLDQGLGLPYQTWASTRALDLDEVAAVIRAAVEGARGVVSVTALTVTRSGRTVTVSGAALVEGGATVPISLAMGYDAPTFVDVLPAGAIA